ncbi:MAG: ABC transporter permease subunit, partial [Clostridia bacterium]|nr:ABC transporter permease subunit [Clostridia bacterium]
RCNPFKHIVQTVSYLPYFISMVVVAGLVIDFTSKAGLINSIVAFFGGERFSMLMEPKMFRTIYIASGIWQNAGWGSILYIAAISGINPELYEAADIDGAGRFRKIVHVTLPGIMPTIIIMLILNIGSMMNVSFEKVILLYSPATYETSVV